MKLKIMDEAVYSRITIIPFVSRYNDEETSKLEKASSIRGKIKCKRGLYPRTQRKYDHECSNQKTQSRLGF